MNNSSLTADAFALAFGDLPVEEALALREGTAFRHFPAPRADRYQALLSVADLDAFLRTGAARCPPVTMADDRREGSAGVPDEAFTREDGRVDHARLFALFDAGASLVVSQFHEMHPPLARFCRGLERLFLHGVQCNVYLTPPGAQGFRVHFDTHDVLVLQVQGDKRWRLWPEIPVPHATRRTPWQGGRVEPEGTPEVLVMRPGDALYVPRGMLHDAAAVPGGPASLHLTIGLLEPCWADMLHSALDLAEPEDAGLRAPFPSWRLGEPEGGAAMLEAMRRHLAALATPEMLERISLRWLDGLAGSRLGLPARGLLSPAPGPEDRLQLTDGMLHHVAALPDGTAELRWSGGREALSAVAQDWLIRLEEGASPAELGEGALEFCRRLAAAGLLEPA